jgi:hypothetical protein
MLLLQFAECLADRPLSRPGPGDGRGDGTQFRLVELAVAGDMLRRQATPCSVLRSSPHGAPCLARHADVFPRRELISRLRLPAGNTQPHLHTHRDREPTAAPLSRSQGPRGPLAGFRRPSAPGRQRSARRPVSDSTSASSRRCRVVVPEPFLKVGQRGRRRVPHTSSPLPERDALGLHRRRGGGTPPRFPKPDIARRAGRSDRHPPSFGVLGPMVTIPA